MKTALIVDDSRAIRLAIRRILEGLGFAVHEAENGAEALKALGTLGVPDCILLDIDMPVMDGLTCLASVRRDHRFDAAAIVMCTTHTSLQQMGAAIEAGANEYIMKPFDLEILKAKLEQVSVL